MSQSDDLPRECGFFDEAGDEDRYLDVGAIEEDGELTFFQLSEAPSTTCWITADVQDCVLNVREECR